jgi:hypothetical protein
MEDAMPDRNATLLTNFLVCGNLDSTIEGRGDHPETQQFMRAMYDFESEHARRREELAPNIRDILNEYRMQKHQAVTEHRLSERKRLLTTRRRQEKELAGGRGASFRSIVDFRRETRRQAEAVISPADSRKLQKVRESAARNLFELLHSKLELKPGEALEDKDVPEAIRLGTHNPPFAAVPPYPWSWTTFYHWFSSGSSEVTDWYLDGSVGRVGHRVTYFNDSPGDSDYCDTEAKSLVGFPVPAQGASKKWKFWIKVKCGASRGLFRWEDEFGSSITENYMFSNMRITISTDPESTNLLYHPFERFGIWYQNWHGDDDWYYLYEFQPHGWTTTYAWTTPFVLPNQSAFETIGTADYTSYWLDDVELNNIMNNRWAIQKVAIELVS